MRFSFRAYVLACCLIPVEVARADVANPEQTKKDARSIAAHHFGIGYKLAQSQQYEAAIVEFEQAYRASPHYTVLYNLGLAYAKAGRHVDARATLRRALAEGGTQVDADVRRRALAAIDESERRIGRLSVKLIPDLDIPLVIDGKSVTRAELDAEYRLSAGSHGIWISAPGYQERYTSFGIRPREITTLEIKLEPLVTQRISAPEPQRADESSNGAAARAIADLQRNEQRQARLRNEQHQARLRNEQHQARLRNWSYVLGGTGLAFGVAAGVLYAVNSADEEDRIRERDQLLQKTTLSSGERRRLGELMSEARDQQRIDDLGILLGISAGACLSTAGYLFWRGTTNTRPATGFSATGRGINWSTTW